MRDVSCFAMLLALLFPKTTAFRNIIFAIQSMSVEAPVGSQGHKMYIELYQGIDRKQPWVHRESPQKHKDKTCSNRLTDRLVLWKRTADCDRNWQALGHSVAIISPLTFRMYLESL